LEADFVQFYGLNLATEMEERPSRAMNLVRQLPPESRLMRSFIGGHRWTYQEELLAQNAELTHALIRTMVGAWGKKKDIPKPWSVRRPWEVRERRVIRSVREMVSALGPVLGRGGYG